MVISALQRKSKFNFELFCKKKKITFFWFPCCSTREDLSIDVSITNVGLILTKLWWFLFSGYGQTDRHGFGILTWKHVGTQKISTQSSKLLISCRSLYASPDNGDAWSEKTKVPWEKRGKKRKNAEHFRRVNIMETITNGMMRWKSLMQEAMKTMA